MLLAFILSALLVNADPVSLSIPIPTSAFVVYPNFLGISFELSFLNQYFGNDTSTIPPAFTNYLNAIHAYAGSSMPVRVRIGGNSMDSSTYVPQQGSPMIQLQNVAANSNNLPANYGPVMWDVLNQVSKATGGVSYLIGLTLLDPNNPDMPVLAGAAQSALGHTLDGFILGNEPDLYTSHGNRPSLANYTVDDYIQEYATASSRLINTTAGNILQKANLAGPTICCAWDLATTLESGYLGNFTSVLKYITLQHYPQNTCSGPPPLTLPYYQSHKNTVYLAQWQAPGINITVNLPKPAPSLIMDEFNSISCGGTAGISDTFAVGSMWTADYALQMASIGYTAAFAHTREAGITYNLFDPPTGGSKNWQTNPPFYAYLVVSEALQSASGATVVDLALTDDSTAGYAVYDAHNTSVNRVVLFNYNNQSSAGVQYTLPTSSLPPASTLVMVKYLLASSSTEKFNISYSGKTFLNGISTTASWGEGVQTVPCSSNGGCVINVPAPGVAVVFVNGVVQANVSVNVNSTDPDPSSSSKKSGALRLRSSWVGGLVLAVLGLGQTSY